MRRFQKEKEGYHQGRLRSPQKGRCKDSRKFKFSLEKSRISQSKVTPNNDYSTERSSKGFVKEKNNSPGPGIIEFQCRPRRAYRMPPKASQVTRIDWTCPRTRKRKFSDEHHNDQSTIRSKVAPTISNDWTDRCYKHQSSYSNLQSNSTQSLDMQHYSSSDRPSLKGPSDQLGMDHSMKNEGNSYLNGSQSRINIPVCCMITTHSTTKRDPETQQNS